MDGPKVFKAEICTSKPTLDAITVLVRNKLYLHIHKYYYKMNHFFTVIRTYMAICISNCDI